MDRAATRSVVENGWLCRHPKTRHRARAIPLFGQTRDSHALSRQRAGDAPFDVDPWALDEWKR